MEVWDPPVLTTRAGPPPVPGHDAADDTIYGGPGNDFLFGGTGADKLRPGDTVGTLVGDLIYGEAGDDTIGGGGGPDTMDGGAGNNILTYFDHTNPVMVNLNNGIADEGEFAFDAKQGKNVSTEKDIVVESTFMGVIGGAGQRHPGRDQGRYLRIRGRARRCRHHHRQQSRGYAWRRRRRGSAPGRTRQRQTRRRRGRRLHLRVGWATTPSWAAPAATVSTPARAMTRSMAARAPGKTPSPTAMTPSTATPATTGWTDSSATICSPVTSVTEAWTQLPQAGATIRSSAAWKATAPIPCKVTAASTPPTTPQEPAAFESALTSFTTTARRTKPTS